MKRIVFSFNIIIAFIILAVIGSVFAQAKKHEFILRNQTGVEIHQLFLSPHSSDDWAQDVLGRDTLPDGEAVQINFDDRDKHDVWDLKVVDGKGASITWEKLDLTKVSDVTIHYKEGKAWAEVK